MNGESWFSWLGCLRDYLKQTRMTLDLEEHFWARPSSSKVGTELKKGVGTELKKGVGTELKKGWN